MHCIALRPMVISGVAAKLAGSGALVLAPNGWGIRLRLGGCQWTVEQARIALP
jgi:hypothetical protein